MEKIHTKQAFPWGGVWRISGAGRLLYAVGFVLYMLSGAEGLETVPLSVLFILHALSLLTILAGVVWRIRLCLQAKQSPSGGFPGKRRRIACGLCIYGALAGGVCAVSAAALDGIFGYETGLCLAAQCLMAVGAMVGFLCGLPMWKALRRQAA